MVGMRIKKSLSIRSYYYIGSCEQGLSMENRETTMLVPESCKFASRSACMFYKLIVASILQDQKLKIPGKFLKKYGDEMSSVITLSVPSGLNWSVELQKANGKLWFNKGWQAFLLYLSVRVGYLLVFKYMGRSHFDVNIFDLTISEINYPSGAPGSLEQHHESQCLENKVDEFEPTNISGKDSLAVLNKAEAKCRSLNRIMQTYNEPDATSAGGPKARYYSRRNVSKALTMRSSAAVTESEERAVRAAYKFKSDYPYFRSIMGSYNVNKVFILRVPASFGRKYLSDVTSLITLQSPNGTKWRVRAIYRNGRTTFSKGWIRFARENNLEEGDVCVFELISSKDVVFRVTMFRACKIQEQLAGVQSENDALN